MFILKGFYKGLGENSQQVIKAVRLAGIYL
jgi:hypothetical protein